MFSKSNTYQYEGLQHFKEFLLDDKVKMLQSETSLPLKYWEKEKADILNLITKHIAQTQSSIMRRSMEAHHACKIHCEMSESLDTEALVIFKEKWVYIMSYIAHDISELNELRRMFTVVNDCQYKSMEIEHEKQNNN